jgi:hypothetical protein
MDLAELVTVGAKIAEIGERLKILRGQRDELNVEISALEKELMPLVVQHSKIIAEVLGTPLPVPSANGAPPQEYGGLPPGRQPSRDQSFDLKRRIIEFLEGEEPGLSAAEIATALKADPFQVRQIMADMARSGK